MMDNSRISISFVVIGLNEEVSLDGCFQSITKAISKLDRAEYEIIYVDSGSSDRSVDIARGVRNCKIFKLTKNRSASAARKVGELNAKYNYILFLDGDMLLDVSFLENIFSENILSDSTVGCIGLRQENTFNYFRNEFEIKTKDFYKNKNMSNVKHIGGAFLVRRDVLIKSGGFQPDQIMWEEQLVLSNIMSLGYNIKCINIPFIIHNNRKTASYSSNIRSYCKRYGTGYYFSHYIFNSYKNGSFKYTILNQSPFFCFLGFFSLFLFISFFKVKYALLFLFIFSLIYILVFGKKNLAHSVLRLLSLVRYFFTSKNKFEFCWKYENK
ncbi:hypothetical protein DDT52_12520 [Brenneria roseae subsp. roseae]|uniref:glycosyltransferase family 2 protein n=1 Tax=Brenneria roseae TaxID=1509241 RepID=UPI000D61B79A|nr:glycosyltransferase family 2 protein [Brenneria roseae]PWC19119.1 hypothetical protein DDT52_12520 [Brenneria roseae subsp. roseae]